MLADGAAHDHVRAMTWRRSATLALAAAAMLATSVSPQLHAQGVAPATVLSGRCQYPDRVARFRQETSLILCDTVSISQEGDSATLDFSQRSWGSMMRFAGDMRDNRMTISRVFFRDGSSTAASGTCETFHSNGELSAVACLARTGTRSWAANFIRSRV